MSRDLYGPYTYRGCFITEAQTDPVSRSGLLMDRHGSFFDYCGRSFFICNDQSFPGSTMYFRNSIIAEVVYLPNGDIRALDLTTRGVRCA